MSPMASNTEVKLRAPMRRRWALSFEKAISMGFKSGEYGGKYKNQHPWARNAAAASLLWWVARLSRITAVPGAISGIKTWRTYAAKAGPSIAPLITQADPTEDTLIRVQMAAFGYQFSEVHKAVGLAHDHLFHEAEVAGEMRESKLGTKMAAATNFCDADFIAGDEITRKIIEDDDDIASQAADVYIGFVRLAEEIRLKRLELLSKDPEKPTPEEANASTNFMLSLKAKYHGEPMLRTVAGVVDMLTGVIARSLSKNKDDLH